ncbi:MAG: leucine-rich repeat protein [Eubacterium sp.]|nr:leucine-rich repeat protein [Eubacterium sp.]
MGNIKAVKYKKRIISLVLLLSVFLSSYIDSTASRIVGQTNEQLKDYAVSCINALVAEPGVGSIGGEWAVLTLGRAGAVTPEFKAKYMAHLREKMSAATSTVNERNSSERIIREFIMWKKNIRLMSTAENKTNTACRLHEKKATENERVIIALSALCEPVIIDGYDLAEPLYDFSYTTGQGINGAIFGLIALDMAAYYREGEAPLQTTANDEVSVRDDLLRFILERELAGGGWTMIGTQADPDITFMALQALAPYYGRDEQVKSAVDRVLTAMSVQTNIVLQNTQTEVSDEFNGRDTGVAGVESNSLNKPAGTAETAAQKIVALTSLDINPRTDPRFFVDGKSAVDELLAFRTKGGFAHTLNKNSKGLTWYEGAEQIESSASESSGNLDRMATEQGAYACVALWLLDHGKHLYDHLIWEPGSGVPPVTPGTTIAPESTMSPTMPTPTPEPGTTSVTGSADSVTVSNDDGSVTTTSFSSDGRISQIEVEKSNDNSRIRLIYTSTDGIVMKLSRVRINGSSYSSISINSVMDSAGVSHRVICIVPRAVRGSKQLRSVTLGSNIKTIGSAAFEKCSNLKRLTLSAKNLKSIGKNAIRGIHQRAVIRIQGNNKQYKSVVKKITKKATGYESGMTIMKLS